MPSQHLDLPDFIRTAASVVAYENGCFHPSVFVHVSLTEAIDGWKVGDRRSVPQARASPSLFPLLRPGDDPTRNPGPYSFMSWLDNGVFPSIASRVLRSFTLALWSEVRVTGAAPLTTITPLTLTRHSPPRGPQPTW